MKKDFLGLDIYMNSLSTDFLPEKSTENTFFYLNKGEKIQTLLKKKEVKKFKKSNFLNIVNETIFKNNENFVKRIRKKLILPTLQNYVDSSNDYVEFDDFLNLFEEFKKQILIEEERTGYSCQLMQSLMKNKEQRIAKIRIQEKEYIAPLGKNLRPSKNGRAFRLMNSYDYKTCVDWGYFFSFAIAQLQLRSYLKKKWETLSEAEQENDIVYHFLKSKLKEKMELYQENKILQICPEIGEEIRKQLEKYSIPFQENQNGMNKNEFSPIFYLGSEDIVAELFHIQHYRYNENGNFTAGIMFGSRPFFEELLKIVYKSYQIDKKEDEFQKNLSKEYATSYQTKRNIPKKTLVAMEQSGFNQYFGYVEFDEECDIEKTKVLYKKFSELAQYLNWEKEEEVSLRFRKLGKHKASGLYYPSLKCLCVDINSPQSMAHEYFHMLDYKYGNLSKGYTFYEIYQCYVEEIKKDKKNYELLKHSKSKYNLSYYLQPTEVFARCGEIYLVRILGIDNSIVEPDDGFAYPKSKKLEEKITQFFTRFFEKESRLKKLSNMAGEI